MAHNYLIDRWPQSGESLRREEERRRVRRRRTAWSAGVLSLFLCAIGGLTLAARLAAGGPVLPAQPGGEEDPAPSASLSQVETTLPRFPAGAELRLEFDQTPARTLTAAQIHPLVLPSIVSIETYTPSAISSGTGIVISEDGYLVTNYHVIEGGRIGSATLLESGKSYSISLVGYDEATDLAVLKIDAHGLTPAAFGDSALLQVGEPAYAIGNPLGYLTGSMTDGIISAVSRQLTVGGYDMTLIQTSAALSAGNSGGALVNDRGQVVGVTSAKLNDPDSSTEGLSLAIPSRVVRRTVNSILRIGRASTPLVGISCYAVEEPVAGIYVADVTAGGPAHQAGVEPGDILTAVGDVPVSTVDALREELDQVGVGGEARLTLWREGTLYTATAVLVEGGTGR